TAQRAQDQPVGQRVEWSGLPPRASASLLERPSEEPPAVSGRLTHDGHHLLMHLLVDSRHRYHHPRPAFLWGIDQAVGAGRQPRRSASHKPHEYAADAI